MQTKGPQRPKLPIKKARKHDQEKSNPVSFDDLESHQIECEAQLVSLKDEQASIILNGGVYDNAAIVKAQGELEAINRAQLALIGREALEAEAEVQCIANLTDAEHRAAKVLIIETIAAARLDVVKEMEDAARAFSSAYIRAGKAGSGLFAALQSEGVDSVGLVGHAVGTRIGYSLSAVLSRATGTNGLGDVKLRVGIADAGASWLDAEAAVGRDVEAAIFALTDNFLEGQAA